MMASRLGRCSRKLLVKTRSSESSGSGHGSAADCREQHDAVVDVAGRVGVQVDPVAAGAATRLMNAPQPHPRSSTASAPST